jgi:hypothetical protein
MSAEAGERTARHRSARSGQAERAQARATRLGQGGGRRQHARAYIIAAIGLRSTFSAKVSTP